MHTHPQPSYQSNSHTHTPIYMYTYIPTPIHNCLLRATCTATAIHIIVTYSHSIIQHIKLHQITLNVIILYREDITRW